MYYVSQYKKKWTSTIKKRKKNQFFYKSLYKMILENFLLQYE